jgi:putative inorganic carbon (HCO3(-)) transporter
LRTSAAAITHPNWRGFSRPSSRATTAYAGLLLFIAVVYANPGNWWPQLGSFAFAKIAAALSLAALGVSWLLYDHPLSVGGLPGGSVVAIFAWLGLSASWSFYPSFTFELFLDGLKYLAIFLLVVNVVDSERRLRQVVAFLACITAVPAIGGIWSFLHGEHLVEGDRAGWIGIFANPNDLAYHMVVGLTLALASREQERQPILRAFYLGLIALDVSTVLLTKSRGGMIATLVAGSLWMLRSFKRARTTFGAILTVLGVLSLGPDNPWRSRNERALSFGQDISARGRVDAWRTALNVVEERPLTGVGGGAFMIAWPIFAPGDTGPARTEHNTFVQLVAELGLPGLCFFLLPYGMSLVALGRAGAPALESSRRGLQAALAGTGVCSLTAGLALSWPLYLLLGLAAVTRRLHAVNVALPSDRFEA